MRGARSAATETYQVDRRGSEHRATKQMVPAAVFQQPAKGTRAASKRRAGRFQKRDFLGRGCAAEHGIAVGKAAEAANDFAMPAGVIERVCQPRAHPASGVLAPPQPRPCRIAQGVGAVGAERLS